MSNSSYKGTKDGQWSCPFLGLFWFLIHLLRLGPASLLKAGVPPSRTGPSAKSHHKCSVQISLSSF